MYGIGFYDEYLSRMGNLKNKLDLATSYKIEYLKTLLKDNKVYKFISFKEHGEMKLKTLKEEKIWFSFYKTLNDDTEFQINYKIEEVVSKWTAELKRLIIKDLLDIQKEQRCIQ